MFGFGGSCWALNVDGFVDLGDFACFADCLVGPVHVPPDGCACADIDACADVDLADFAGFQVRLGDRSATLGRNHRMRQRRPDRNWARKRRAPVTAQLRVRRLLALAARRIMSMAECWRLGWHGIRALAFR
jgi:hypothetical protein